MDEQVRELLLADGVKRESIEPYVTAWRWAESGKPSARLAESTIRQYESDSQRVYRLLGKPIQLNSESMLAGSSKTVLRGEPSHGTT